MVQSKLVIVAAQLAGRVDADKTTMLWAAVTPPPMPAAAADRDGDDDDDDDDDDQQGDCL
jgi:hypothetical protein